MIKLKGDTNKLISGVSLSWLRFALSIGIGLVQTPILFNNLSSNELNFWYIFYSFGAFLQMADLGLIQTISRLIAYIDNVDEITNEALVGSLRKYKTKQIYTTALFSFICILIIVGAIIYLSFLYLHLGNKISFDLKTSFLIYIVSIIFTLLSNIPGAMLIGYRDISPESIVRSIFQILYFLLLLIGLPYYKSLTFVSVAFLIQSLGQFIALHFCFYVRHNKVFKEVVLTRELIKLNISRNIYNQSMPLVVNQLGAWLINQGNIFVAAVFVGSEKISDYAINQQVFTYISSVALVVNQTIGPFIAKQYIQNKQKIIEQLFLGTVIFCLSIVSILLIIQIVCGSEIINLWVGDEHYLGLTFSIMFGLVTFLEVHHSVGGNFVWNTGSWPFNIWTLAAGLLNVSFGYLLSKHYGLIGMAFATFISRLFTLNWYVIYYCLKQLGILLKSYLSRIFIPIIIILILVYFTTSYLKVFLQKVGLDDIIVVMSASAASFILVSLVTGIVFRDYLLRLYRGLVIRK